MNIDTGRTGTEDYASNERLAQQERATIASLEERCRQLELAEQRTRGQLSSTRQVSEHWRKLYLDYLAKCTELREEINHLEQQEHECVMRLISSRDS